MPVRSAAKTVRDTPQRHSLCRGETRKWHGFRETRCRYKCGAGVGIDHNGQAAKLADEPWRQRRRGCRFGEVSQFAEPCRWGAKACPGHLISASLRSYHLMLLALGVLRMQALQHPQRISCFERRRPQWQVLLFDSQYSNSVTVGLSRWLGGDAFAACGCSVPRSACALAARALNGHVGAWYCC